MTKLFVFLLSAVCAVNVFGALMRGSNKVKVKVCYEALCPQCQKFWTTEVGPVYSELSDYMDIVQVLPFGIAFMTEVNGKVVVKCQHGKEECYGNTIHACAIDILKDPKVYVPYIACMMKGDTTDDEATKCASERKIDVKPILKCAKSDRGHQLLVKAGKEVIKENLELILGMVVNGYILEDTDDFKTEICKRLSNPPAACKK